MSSFGVVFKSLLIDVQINSVCRHHFQTLTTLINLDIGAHLNPPSSVCIPIILSHFNVAWLYDFNTKAQCFWLNRPHNVLHYLLNYTLEIMLPFILHFTQVPSIRLQTQIFFLIVKFFSLFQLTLTWINRKKNIIKYTRY